MKNVADIARCGNCVFAGAVRLNASRRRVTTDPKVFCSRWKKDSHPFGVCPDHQMREPEQPRGDALACDPAQLFLALR